MEPRTEKFPVSELYKLTLEILTMANNNPDVFGGIKERPKNNFERRREEYLEGKRKELQYLIGTMEYQILHYYPRLRSLFMPRASIKEYKFGKVRTSIPPQRWEEPLVQYFLQNFAEVILKPDKEAGRNNDKIDFDTVYSGIMNPDIRDALRQRKMSEKEYTRLDKLLEGYKANLQSLPSGQPQTNALMPIPLQTSGLVKSKELERRLDNIPLAILAVEAGLNEQTVKKYKARGLSGQEIVDGGFMIKDMSTNGVMIHNLRMSGIPEDQWEDLIFTARRIEVPVAMLIRVMNTLGTNDVQDISGIIDDIEPTVSEFAEERRMRGNRAWYFALSIYSGDGRGDVNRTLDILAGHYWARLDEEDSSDALEINQSFSLEIY